jgi:osmotically-inducible protein OsmY
MRPGDAMLKRKVRSEFIKRELITEHLEVQVIHGVAYLSGDLRGTRARKIVDWKHEMAIIETAIAAIHGIRGIDNHIKYFDL